LYLTPHAALLSWLQTRNTMLQGVMFFATVMTAAGIVVSFGKYDHTGTVFIW
jgi:hypothetical protein